MANEAVKYVWEGAIPLQIHLHKSDVASHPAPPPALVLAPRLGYLPLLIPLIKPYFKDSLPPGEDSIWFDYKGIPLKWYIPTGVLFDLLCAEPERPWNLTIHFRGYPSNILIPYEGEDSVKWNFVNSLKERVKNLIDCVGVAGNDHKKFCYQFVKYAASGTIYHQWKLQECYMSHSDQEDLWSSVMNGDLDAYTRLSTKLKIGTIEDEFSKKISLSSPQSRQGVPEMDVPGQVKTARIPVRLYVRSINQDFENIEDVPEIDTWDDISYLNRPVELLKEEGKCFTLRDAIESLLPEFIGDRAQTSGEERTMDESEEADALAGMGEIKLARIQGIEMKLEIPFSWVVNNLMNPEFYLHISVLVKAPQR